MSQKQIFLDSEGDQWFNRNSSLLSTAEITKRDPIISSINDISFENTPTRVLEIGCGHGLRLSFLKQNHGFEVYGIDPSRKSVEYCKTCGLNAQVATADRLPYPDNFFDIIVFGFCLYLCDRSDLFLIASEADRALKSVGYISILDFWSKAHRANPYHHFSGIRSYKMDSASLFSWHPYYTLFSHRLISHEDGFFTDDPDQWVSSTLLRRKPLD